MKNNKLICIVLALLVCLTIAVSASATTETNTNLTFKLESTLDSSQGPATTVEPGAEFTVNVVLESNPGVKFYVAYLNYNAENLDLTNIESKNDNVTVKQSVAADGRLVVTVGDVAALIGEGKVVTDTGVVAVLTFKVKATEEDISSGNNISLEVDGNNVVDANGNIGTEADVEVSEVEPIVPTVVAKDHVCDEKNLITHGAVAATCEQDGFEGDIVCPVCNKVFVEGKTLNKLGHDLDQENFEIKTEPTCDTDGVKVLHCKREGCTHTEEAPIAKHDHDYQTVKGYAATCTAEGLTDGEQCTICKAWKTERKAIAALGHDYQHQYNISEATCEKAGTEWVKCSRCENTTAREVPAKDHTPVDVAKKDATCAEAGHEAGKVCSVCNKTLEGLTEIAVSKEHTMNAGSITTLPTCGAMGVRTYTCTVCGETKVDDKVPATGNHTYGEWKVTTEATTETEGVKTRECSVCGAKENAPIEKLPEPENNTVVIVVVAAVVVLAGAGVAAYFVLKNKKKI